jgi:hypothetical protein
VLRASTAASHARIGSSASTRTGCVATEEDHMNTYVIERGIDGIGGASAAELQAISQKSVSVLDELGTGVQWVHSYVTGDKIYCVYRSGDAELVREHASRGGFPADSVALVAAVIDPTTA